MTLLEMSLTGGAMIVLIIILRALLMNQLPKRTFVCLWALALIRLMLPFSIPVALPWATQPEPSVLPVAVTQVRTFAQSALPAYNPWPGTVDPQSVSNMPENIQPWTTDQTSPATKPIDWLLLGYCAGMALVGLYLLSAYVMLRREFKKSRELTDGPAVAFVKAHNLRRQVLVLASGRIKSPITYGLIRPCILLPESMVDDESQLPYVLTHELTHIRRLDAPMKLLFAACLCLHWFNPLVWAMYILYNRDVELACDERVVRELGTDSRAGYAALLLNMQEGRNRLTPLCNSFSRYSLKERIVSISKYKKTSALAMLLALVLVVVVGTAFATRAEQETVESHVTIEEMDSFDPGTDIGALFTGFKPYGSGLITNAPDEEGRVFYDLIPMQYDPGYGLPGNEQSDQVIDLLRGITLGETSFDDEPPVWRFGISATLTPDSETAYSQRDVALSLFEGSNLALLSVTDWADGNERRSGTRYGSLTDEQIEACEAIYEANQTDRRMPWTNGARVAALFSQQAGSNGIRGAEPFTEGEGWSLFSTDMSDDVFLLRRVSDGASQAVDSLVSLDRDNTFIKYNPKVAPNEIFEMPRPAELLASGIYPATLGQTSRVLSTELGELFEGYNQYEMRLLAFDPASGGPTSRELIVEDRIALFDIFEALTLGEPPIQDLDKNPLPLFSAQAMLSESPPGKQRDISLQFYKDTELVLLTVSDHGVVPNEDPDRRLYGSLPHEQKAAIEDIYQRNAPRMSEAMPMPTSVPNPVPGAAWLDQKWDENYYKELDPRVAGLMELDWQNLSVAQFQQEVRRAIDTRIDDLPLDFRDLYGTYEDDSVADFIFGPLQRTMVELGEIDEDGTLWHPGDPRGIQAFAINPSLEAYADNKPYVQLDYLLTCDTLQPDALTVAEREEMLAVYRERISDWVNRRDMSELIQSDMLPLIRAERDRSDKELSTPQLRIRAINFRGRYYDGKKVYETPGDFVDNMENPTSDPPIDDPNIEEIHYSNLTKIRVGTIYKDAYDEDLGETTRQDTAYFVSMGGQDQPWHKDGWRDPTTGLSVKFFPDLGWPLISPDNGMSWWREIIPDGGSPDGSMEFQCVVNTISSDDLKNWTLWYTPTTGWKMNRV